MARTKALLICLFCFFFFLGKLYSQSFVYDQQLIKKIEIDTEHLPPSIHFNPTTILSRIKTKAGNFFSQTTFDQDLKALVLEFDHVEPYIRSAEGGELVITLKVWPKPTIRAIQWHGNTRIDTGRLENELSIRPKSVFDRLEFNRAFHKLKTYYVKKGFFEVNIDYQVNLDADTNEVDIEIFIEEGRAGKIKKIVFRNFTPQEECEIIELMCTKEWSFFTSWLNSQGTYQDEAIQQDEFLILNYLQNQGYADARVDVDVCEVEKDWIIVYITATKGDLYRFGPITFEGNCLFPDDVIHNQLLVCEGDPYSPDKLRETVRNLMNFYGRQGYIDTIVDFEPRLMCDAYQYSTHITIEESPQYRVGLIKVIGNCSTQTHVILHETLLIPGEVFNIEKLTLTEERLRNIGYFKNINVYAIKSDEICGLGENYRDIQIEVEEMSTGRFGAFGAFSTTERLYGGFNITENNFNYRGLSTLFTEGFRNLRGGGEFLHFTFSLGSRSSNCVLSWTKPWFMDTPWSVGFDLERASNRYISKDYDIESWGFTLHGSYDVNAFVKVGCHYRLRDSHIKLSSDASELLKEEAKNSGIISAVGGTIHYDSTDNPQCPTDGLKSRLEYEYAGLGGRHTFFALGYINTWYYPLTRDGVFRVRADARYIMPLGHSRPTTIPIDERFFLGGENTIRGYRSYKLGPKYPGGDPRGGISMNYFSAEYDHKLFSKFDGFVFADAGNLSLKEWQFARLYVSVGLGLKFRIFPGSPPLEIGFGFPLNAKTRGEVKRFFLNVGGRF